MKIMQHYLTPVIRYSEKKKGHAFEKLHGTAFFINGNGAFLTAAHVMRDAEAEAEEKGDGVCLIMRKPEDDQHVYKGNIKAVSYADDPYDVAVGVVAHRSMSCFMLGDTGKVWTWQEVYTAGYAESAVSRDGENVRPDIRSLKGYVTRKVPSGEFLAKVGPHPAAFEVDFAIPTCMSGSPLLLKYGPNEEPPPGAPFPLLGICTGTEKITVGLNNLEHYGVVHDLWSLRDWKPECLDGETLCDAIRPENWT